MSILQNVFSIGSVVHEIQLSNDSNCTQTWPEHIIIIIIKEIFIAPFRHAPKALCKQKVKC